MPLPLVATALANPGITSAAISAGGKIIGSLLGRKSAKRKAKAEKAEADRQFGLSQRELALAEEQAQLARAGQIDANGNRIIYDPATNTWKTELTPEQRRLLDASNLEEQRTLTYDAPAARAEAMRQRSARQQQGDIAQGLEASLVDEIAGRGQLSAPQIAASLRRSRAAATGRGFDEVKNSVATMATRTGGDQSRTLTSLARARGQAIAESTGNPDLEARELAENINATRVNNRRGAYESLSDRANSGGGFNFTPSGTPTLLTQSMLNRQQIGQSGLTQAQRGVSLARQPIAQPGIYNNDGRLFSALADDLAGYVRNRKAKDTQISKPTVKQ